MTRRVAITGLGFVTPLGTDVHSTWEGLIAGRSGAGPITRFDPVQSPVKFACEVKGFEPGKFLDKKEVRRYDLFAQFAIGAAEEAVADACLATNWDSVNLKRVGVLIGTGTGGLQTFEENCRALFEKGPSRVSPFFVPMYMPNVGTKNELLHGVGVRVVRPQRGRRPGAHPERQGRHHDRRRRRGGDHAARSGELRQHESAVRA